MRHLIALFAVYSSLFTLHAGAQPLAVPPFTFAGRIVDYEHAAYNDEEIVEIRVKAKDGMLLAKTQTATNGRTTFNYAIDIPLATDALSRHVKTGDEVVFEFVDPEGVVFQGLVPSSKALVGNPGDYAKLDVILALDSDGDGVPDKYVDQISYEMSERGIESYDPNADYDSDGQSNYAEYRAGTNPFDATDMFTVRQLAEKDGIDDYVALKVEVRQGRTYTVSTIDSLEKGTDVTAWTKSAFSVEDPSSALQTQLTTGLGEIGTRILYVKKDGPNRFWRMNVE